MHVLGAAPVPVLIVRHVMGGTVAAKVLATSYAANTST